MTGFETEQLGGNSTELVAGVIFNRCSEGGPLGQHDWSGWVRYNIVGVKIRTCSKCKEDDVKNIWFSDRYL